MVCRTVSTMIKSVVSAGKINEVDGEVFRVIGNEDGWYSIYHVNN